MENRINAGRKAMQSALASIENEKITDPLQAMLRIERARAEDVAASLVTPGDAGLLVIFLALGMGTTFSRSFLRMSRAIAYVFPPHVFYWGEGVAQFDSRRKKVQ